MRYRELQQQIDAVAASGLSSLTEDDIEESLPHITSWRSKGKILNEVRRYFRKHAVEQMENVLGKYQLRERLDELEAAISDARVRQSMYGTRPELAPPTERPVVLARLTPEELVDAKLAPSRREWITELQQRLDEADAVESGLAQAIKTRRVQLAQREAVIKTKLALLVEARRKLSHNHANSDSSGQQTDADQPIDATRPADDHLSAPTAEEPTPGQAHNPSPGRSQND